MTLDDLVKAGFPAENWPEDLPKPDTDTISEFDGEGTMAMYRYSATVGGQLYAMEVVLDTKLVEKPAEGVGFMLNQFAYLWRTGKEGVAAKPDGSCRRINF